jgi:hypothetical protein
MIIVSMGLLCLKPCAMQSMTLLEAYKQFSETEACQANPRLLDNLRTTLRRYILPCYESFSASELRTDLDGCLSTISLAQFLTDAPQLLELLEKGVAPTSNRSISSGTVTNYRSALLRFFNWMYTQDWKTSAEITHIPKFAPALYNGQTSSSDHQKSRHFRNGPYALQETELPDVLRDQLHQLEIFCTCSELLHHQGNVILESTFKAYKESILCFLGWQRNIKRRRLTRLSLIEVIDLEQLQEFITWGIERRGNGTGWAINITLAVMAVAKWLVATEGLEGRVSVPQKLKDYLQMLTVLYSSKDTESQCNNIEPLTFDESVKVVQYLKQCCAPYSKAGALRSETAIIRSWQRYLILALLVYTPLRQREITKLEAQKSLFREQDGYWIRLPSNPANDKAIVTKEVWLPSHLVADLDTWMQSLRPKIKANHALVFIRTGSGRVPGSLGQPLSDRDISDLVSTAIRKATTVLFGSPKRKTLKTFQSATLAHLGRLGHEMAVVGAPGTGKAHALGALMGSHERVQPSVTTTQELQTEEVSLDEIERSLPSKSKK